MHEEAERLTMLEWARTKAKWFLGSMAAVMIGALFLGLQTGDVDCGSARTAANPAAVVDSSSTVATVGTENISYSDWSRRYSQVAESTKWNSPPGTLISPLEDFQMKSQAIVMLINSKLLTQEALEHGIMPDPEKVEERIQLYESQLLEPLATKTDRSILQKLGDSLKQRKRERQFNAVIATTSGMTPKEFAQEVRIEVISEQYQEVLAKEAEESVKTDALKKLNDLKAKLDAGEDFVTVAKENSQDMTTKDVGGRIDLLSMSDAFNQYGEAYVETLRATKPGSIAAPVFSDKTKGYYLIKLDNFTRADGPVFEAEKETIRQKIMDKKKEQAAEDPGVKVDATEDEIKDAYERAALWQIFIPVEAVETAKEAQFKKLLDEAQIEVKEPELRAGFLMMVREDTPGAVGALKEAIEKARTESDTNMAAEQDPDLREGIKLSADMEQAELHYVVGTIIASQPDKIEQDRMMKFFQENQNNMEAFSNMPEASAEEKAEAEKQRKEAQSHFETALALNDQNAFYPMGVAQMIMSLQQKDRYPEAIPLITQGLEFGSRDLKVHQTAQQLLTSLKGALDATTQADLVAQADESLATITTKITEIEAAQAEFATKRQAEMDAMRGITSPDPAEGGEVPPGMLSGADAPATQEAIVATPEEGAAPPAEGEVAPPPAEGEVAPPPAEGGAEVVPPVETPAEGETPPPAGGE